MDQSSSQNQPNFDLPPLPPLNGEQADTQPPQEAAPERGAPAMEQPGSSQPQPPVPPAPLPSLPVNDPVTVPAAGQPPLPVIDDSPLIADDVDLIEKEWVNKAKAIVEQTRDDPFKQNKEINKIKADYIKKRYNKDIKITEG